MIHVLMFMVVYGMLFLNLLVIGWLMRLLFKRKMMGTSLEEQFTKARKFMRWNGIFTLFFCGEAGLMSIISGGGSNLRAMYSGYTFLSFMWFAQLAMALVALVMLYRKMRKTSVVIENLRQLRRIVGMTVVFLIISSLLASVTSF